MQTLKSSLRGCGCGQAAHQHPTPSRKELLHASCVSALVWVPTCTYHSCHSRPLPSRHTLHGAPQQWCCCKAHRQADRDQHLHEELYVAASCRRLQVHASNTSRSGAQPVVVGTLVQGNPEATPEVPWPQLGVQTQHKIPCLTCFPMPFSSNREGKLTWPCPAVRETSSGSASHMSRDPAPATVMASPAGNTTSGSGGPTWQESGSMMSFSAQVGPR